MDRLCYVVENLCKKRKRQLRQVVANERFLIEAGLLEGGMTSDNVYYFSHFSTMMSLMLTNEWSS